MKSIQIIVKNVYGKETLYPACEQAEFLCRIAKTSTITDNIIATCKAFGVEIVEVRPAQKKF